MTHRVTVAVTAEPVSLPEARLQCKVDADDTTHDTYFSGVLIPGAREYAEHYTGRALAPQTLEMALDCFPDCNGVIRLEFPPVASVTSIKYTDLSGVEQTLATNTYAFSQYGDAREISPTYGNYWPSTQAIPNAVRIVYVTGYGATGHAATGEFASIAKAAKSAMLLHIELESPLNPHTPEERATLEKARDALLDTVKVYGYA